jgi:hypothetical protein
MEFTDGSSQSAGQRFKSQARVAYTGQAGALPSNFTANQGINAERVRWLHKQQDK